VCPELRWARPRGFGAGAGLWPRALGLASEALGMNPPGGESGCVAGGEAAQHQVARRV